MKRNFLRKEKCKSSPGGSQLLKGRTRGKRNNEIPGSDSSKKRGAIKRWVILSVGNDLEFDKRLRMAAVQRGKIVIRVETVESALRIIHSECCGVILLDLDFTGKAAWELAGYLMQDSKCPPVILMTGMGEQFDLRMAVLAGSVFEKSADTDQILNIVGDILDATVAEQPRPSIAQCKVIGRFPLSSEPIPLIPARRFWGINE